MPATSGPLPAVQDAVITTFGAVQCDGIISLPGLQTDTPASINYPEGTMTITLNGLAGVTTVVTITTDGTVNAHISVTDIGSLSFTLNLDTLTLTQN